MSDTTSSTRRHLTRLGIGLGAAVAATLALPGVAQAHVTIQPESAEGGSFSVVAFRVPNERDDASTTRVRVTLPEDQPLGSVRTTPVPGWRISTETRELDEPIDLFGEQLDSVVSQVTWTATGDGIEPGQFQDFDLSIGPLPESGELVFSALQTYSSGEKVNWNQVSADESVEPEHPAPTLALSAPAAEAGTAAGDTAGTAAEGTDQSDQAATAATTQDDDSSSTLPVVLSALALVVSVIAAVLAWRRGGGTAGGSGTPTAPSREDVNA